MNLSGDMQRQVMQYILRVYEDVETGHILATLQRDAAVELEGYVGTIAETLIAEGKARGLSPDAAPDTALERWKTLARAENAAARRIWGNSGWTDRGSRPKTPKELEAEARRRRRVERIVRWHGAGVDIEEIARRLGVRPGTIQAILREQRRAAQRRAEAGDG